MIFYKSHEDVRRVSQVLTPWIACCLLCCCPRAGKAYSPCATARLRHWRLTGWRARGGGEAATTNSTSLPALVQHCRISPAVGYPTLTPFILVNTWNWKNKKTNHEWVSSQAALNFQSRSLTLSFDWAQLMSMLTEYHYYGHNSFPLGIGLLQTCANLAAFWAVGKHRKRPRFAPSPPCVGSAFTVFIPACT